MSDIVDLLRDWAAHPEYRNDGAGRCLRAAEEIEQLRGQVTFFEEWAACVHSSAERGEMPEIRKHCDRLTRIKAIAEGQTP